MTHLYLCFTVKTAGASETDARFADAIPYRTLWKGDTMSYLIKDTTEEERRRIVEESLGNLSGACDGCSQRVADMYDAYIRGEMELRDINMAFSTRYVKGAMERDPRSSCPMIE